ncbi:hypothetical protein [Cutibacterium avidum]|uniref:hypothetical protein n=1 Tax=Cutibacterium avidum TaxID=33010 RepID=UPI0033664226
MTELNAQEHDERPSWTGRAVLTGIGFFVAACLVAWLRIEQYSQAMAIIGSALYTLLMWFSAGSFVLAIYEARRPRLALGDRSLRVPIIVGLTCLVGGFIAQTIKVQLVEHSEATQVTVASEILANVILLLQEFGVICLAVSLVVACIRSRDR